MRMSYAVLRRATAACALVAALAAAGAEQNEPTSLGVGDAAPDFSLPALNDTIMIKLADYRGKFVYLDFWSSWCLPCRISMPLLSALRDELAEDDFEIVAINVDRIPREGREFLSRYPVSYPVASDSTGQTAERYHLDGMPTSFLVDRNGVVRLVKRGFKEQDIKELRAVVSSLLQGQ